MHYNLEVAIQLYIIPQAHSADGKYNAPKYVAKRILTPLVGLENVSWSWEFVPSGDVGVIAVDGTAAEHALLAAQTDVLQIPALDNTIPNNTTRNRVRTVLEGFNLPGNWVNTGMTYRSVLRVTIGSILFLSRLTSRLQRKFFDGSLSLTTTVSQLPLATRNELQSAAGDMGLDYSAVTGTTTVRELLRLMGAQFANTQFGIRGVLI